MTKPSSISKPTYRDAGPIAELIAEAFQPLDQVAWLVPDPERRREVLAANFRILVEHALFFGEVDLMHDRSAVAVWFNRTRTVPPPVDYERRLADACHPYTDRFQLLDKLFDAHHPTEPHHHLAFLAVSPNKQCAGRGTALLNHHHAQLDHIGLPAYLEASSSGSRDLYARHGYQQRDQFHLPDGSAFYPMWRPAESSATNASRHPTQLPGPGHSSVQGAT
ncbi:GNAT family N-acetyltransferase [Solwaraspora sp. WMMD406]|uniref:GNAT family N-acetyltransferase n=1 Tax=Solwaraspora sp. WMMD406 TaxID=3016095 RepID=UPI002415F03A|nr:GNAT family N-acetyltransferase [Solwaraspora sp. WMMD406]MDG4768551.1 GNAT family N-acetyltransferase [Solwaraspora sp. WMMD406]